MPAARVTSIAGLLCFIAFTLLPVAAKEKILRSPATYSERVRQFLYAVDSPVLIVGKLAWVDSSDEPCTIQNTRSTTWSISRVLYGFDPGKKLDIRFGACGGVDPRFKSQDEMLIIAYPSYNKMWMGMTESVVPATDANIQIARKVMDDYLRTQIRELVRPLRVAQPRPVLVFVGMILDSGPPRGDQPCISAVPPSFPVKFQIDQIIRGDWSDKEVTVGFPGCGPLHSPTYHSGQHVVAFALRVEPEPPVVFRAGFLLPLDQLAEAQRALQAVEASIRRTDSGR
jgi:hypothetical protein